MIFCSGLINLKIANVILNDKLVMQFVSLHAAAATRRDVINGRVTSSRAKFLITY